MSKITKPVTFAQYWSVPPGELDTLGVLNPFLAIDTALFIDPCLLPGSRQRRFALDAERRLKEHFGHVIRLLRACQRPGDPAWKAAAGRLSFPEVKGIGLGYGVATTAGSGSGQQITQQLTATAKQIIDLGITDPDLFLAMALFEKGFGPDRVSDMTAGVIVDDIVAFSSETQAGLGLCPPAMTFRHGDRKITAEILENPLLPGSPVLLLPTDILRELPIVTDPASIDDAASENRLTRLGLNRMVGYEWRRRSKRQKKEDAREVYLSSRSAFENLLAQVKDLPRTPYDLEADPDGIRFRDTALAVVANNPMQLAGSVDSAAEACRVVDDIIERFRFLIEKRRLSEELYHEGKPRKELAAQRLFFLIADAYCSANDLDVTAEAETGVGPVDFKISRGFNARVVVEIKLSTNNKVVAGYTRQLEAYRQAEETDHARYVVIDVGGLGNKLKSLRDEEAKARLLGGNVPPITLIDASRTPSASKR